MGPRIFFSIIFHNITCPTDNSRDLTRLGHCIRRKFSEPTYSRVIYTESHDTIPGDRQRRLPVAVAGENPDQNVFAVKRSILAAIILMTTPGMPMLLQGQEFFEVASPKWPVPPTINWERRVTHEGVFNAYSTLVPLRANKYNTTLGLTGPNVKVYHVNDHDKVMAYHRFKIGGAQDDVVVVVNFSNQDFLKYKVGFPRSGRWYVRFNSDSKKYHEQCGGVWDVEYVDAKREGYDNYFFSGVVGVGRYAGLILSQEYNKDFLL